MARRSRRDAASVEPGEGKMTASARLTALPEGGAAGAAAGKASDSQETDACCRESAECRGKLDKPEPSKEGKAGGELRG